MSQDEMLQLIFDKLVSLEQGQKSLEQGQKSLEQGQKSLEQGQKSLEHGQKALEQGQISLEQGQKALEQGQKSLEQGLDNLKSEILMNRQAITELQTEVQDIKQAMRFYDYKLVEHEKQIFKLRS